MHFLELFLIAVGLAMDAFAVSICTGLTISKVTIKKSSVVGLYFGVFQGVMPFGGYMLATQFADKIMAYDHWIAFTLLCLIGGKMFAGSFEEEGASGGVRPDEKETSLSPAKMLPLALATSIDALAIGVSFAFLQVNIVSAVFLIGITTLALSMVGVKIGSVFGMKFKLKAELAGGVILIFMGVKILLEHLGILNL